MRRQFGHFSIHSWLCWCIKWPLCDVGLVIWQPCCRNGTVLWPLLCKAPKSTWDIIVFSLWEKCWSWLVKKISWSSSNIGNIQTSEYTLYMIFFRTNKSGMYFEIFVCSLCLSEFWCLMFYCQRILFSSFWLSRC